MEVYTLDYIKRANERFFRDSNFFGDKEYIINGKEFTVIHRNGRAVYDIGLCGHLTFNRNSLN